MDHWIRVVVEVSDEAGAVQGWLVGQDAELAVIPSAGDLLMLSADRATKPFDTILGATTFVVLRRHFRMTSTRGHGPVARVIVGAQLNQGLDLVRQRDEWLEASSAALECAYGGCAVDNTREADSAAWTCITSGHNVCLECTRPVQRSMVFCAYHDPSEFYAPDENGD